MHPDKAFAPIEVGDDVIGMTEQPNDVCFGHPDAKAINRSHVVVSEGIDPAARRRQLSMTVESVCADFIRQYARPRNRSWREAERIMDREFVSVLTSPQTRPSLR